MVFAKQKKGDFIKKGGGFMKKLFCAFLILITFAVFSDAYATPIKITLESYSPATFPTVSSFFDVLDINDQLEISRLAALFSLQPEGWNLAYYGGWLQYREPPSWSGHFYFVDIPVPVPVPEDIENLFGYVLTETQGANGAGYLLYFHTDEWCERAAHNIGETVNNYGVIGGGMDGNSWHQCPVTDWGRFYAEVVNPVPEPISLLFLSLGLPVTVVVRRLIKD